MNEDDVFEWIEKQELTIGNKAARVLAARMLYDDYGWSLRKIAKALNVSHEWVRLALSKLI